MKFVRATAEKDANDTREVTRMSDNYRGIDNDGTYKSRHAGGRAERSTSQSYGGNSGQSRPRSSSQSSRPTGGQSRKPMSGSTQRSAHSSAVGKYTGESTQTETAQPEVRSGNFHVSISEDDYFDAEAAKKEMSAARRAAVQPQRSKVGSPANRKRRPMENRNPATAKREYGIDITTKLPPTKFDAVVMAVAHEQFLGLDVEALCRTPHIIYDVKGILDKSIIDGRL